MNGTVKNSRLNDSFGPSFTVFSIVSPKTGDGPLFCTNVINSGLYHPLVSAKRSVGLKNYGKPRADSERYGVFQWNSRNQKDGEIQVERWGGRDNQHLGIRINERLRGVLGRDPGQIRGTARGDTEDILVSRRFSPHTLVNPAYAVNPFSEGMGE